MIYIKLNRNVSSLYLRKLMNSNLILKELGYDVTVFRDDEYIVITSKDGDVVKFDDEICITVYSYGNPLFIERVTDLYMSKRTNRKPIEWEDEWTTWLNDLKLNHVLDNL